MAKKLKQGIEGLIIILIGLFLLVSSLRISNNPIQYSGWTNTLAQAKFIPIVMSSGIVILGAILFIKQVSGKDKTVQLTKAEWIRMGIVLALTTVYIICVVKFKFAIPTAIYAFALIFFLNLKKKKVWFLLLISALAIVLGLFVMPLLINLKLPMF